MAKMRNELQVVFYGLDTAVLNKLQALSRDIPYLSFAVGTGTEVAGKAGLDAIWAGLMAASELFGLAPPFPIHKAIVLEIPKAQVDRGFPRYAVAGVALSADETRTPESTMLLILEALVKAVREFNSTHDSKIARVGILPDDLQIKRVRPEKALEIMHRALG